MTVRATWPDSSRWAATRRAMRRSSPWSCSRSATSRGKVSSCPIETLATGSSSGRGSMPCARSRSRRPVLPGRSRASSRSGRAASPPIRSIPAEARRSSARGPTPGRSRTGKGARKAASRPAGTTVIPPGFFRSLATLATTLQLATPSEQERLVAPRTAAWTASATTRARRKSGATSPMSRYPSSRPVRSTVGTTSRMAAQTVREYSEYVRWRGVTNTACGQRRSASAQLIAERIP